MPAITRYIFRFGLYSLALGVIAIAFLVSAARMLFPLADQYHDEIESLLSESAGYPVQVESLSAKWRGVYPSIALNNIVIRDPDRPDSSWIRMQEMEVWFNPYLYLLNKNIPVNKYKITGTTLKIKKSSNGSLSLNGRNISSGSELSLGFIRGILSSISAIDMEDINFSYTAAGDDPRQINIHAERLELHQQTGHIRIAGVLHRPEDENGFASFIGMLPDEARTFEDANVKFHLQVDTKLKDWLTPWLPGGMSVKQGYSLIQMWGNTRGLSLQDIDVQLAVTDLVWQRTLAGTGEPLLPGKLKGFSTHVRWQRTPQGWTLIADPLLVATPTKTWESGKLVLVHQDATGDRQQRLAGRLDFLNLTNLADWVNSVQEDFSLREKLNELDLQGDVRSIVFSMQGPVTAPQEYTVNASVKGLGFRSIDGLPGISGVDGITRFNQSGGDIVLDSSGFHLMFPVLFRRELYAETMTGVVHWHHDEEMWQIDTKDISLRNQDIDISTRFQLGQSRGDAFPVLDLQSHFENGNVENAWKYLPTGIMDTNVVAWLDRALVSGRVPGGSMIYFGSLQDFPYDQQEGVFEIRFAVEEGILDYGEDWPRIDDFTAEVAFVGSRFETQLVKGVIHGLDIRNAQVSINDLFLSSDIEVEGYLEGSLQDAFGFIAHISENEQVSAALQDLQSSGRTGLDLNLLLPLDDLRKYKLEGKMDFRDSAIHMSKWNADLGNLNGALHYKIDDSGGQFNADRITGALNGQEAVITVVSRPVSRGGISTSTYISSQVDLQKTIKTYLPFDLPLQGVVPVKIRIDSNRYNNGTDEFSLNVKSNLKGTEIGLPDGLGKSREDERPFSLHWQLTSNTDMRNLRIAYGEDVKADLDFKTENKTTSLDSGILNIGSTYSKKPASGLGVFMDKRQFHLDQWWALMESGAGTSLPGGSGLVQEASIHVDKLIYNGNYFNNFTLAAKQDERAWKINISSDTLKGKLLVPSGPGRDQLIEADLDLLSWTTPESGSNTRYRDPRKLSPFKLNSKQFFFNGKDMGKMAVRASTGVNGLEIDSISLLGELFSVKGSGSWTFEQGWHRSRFDIDMETEDLGKVLRQFGFEDSIEGGEANGQVKAEWFGTPAEFELSRLDGDIQLSIRDGRLKDIDAGGGRILGLLSISRLPNRLTLDFSDLFGEGFKFDKIAGHFSIADGDAYTNDLSLTSSAADIEMSGRIGLASKDYDQVAVVSPKMASSLSLIGGLAAGPGVALGLWVADRLIGKQINSLGNVTYSITGSWDDPVVKKLGKDDEDEDDEDVNGLTNGANSWDLLDSEADEF